MYFKIYGSYFLQSPLCFFMDVIMSKNKGVFTKKTVTLLIAIEK